jgi:very-short-patch-repair endonuclease
MTAYLLTAIFLGCIGLSGFVFYRKLTRGAGALRTGFRPKTFLTKNEVEFYKRLQEACGSDFIIMAQVSMGALVDTKLDRAHPQYWKIRAAFSSKILDFVLCHTESLCPLLIIELDDKMHDFDKDCIRDSFSAFAGFKTLRFWSKKKPEPLEIKRQILRILDLTNAN